MSARESVIGRTMTKEEAAEESFKRYIKPVRSRWTRRLEGAEDLCAAFSYSFFFSVCAPPV